MPDPLNLQERLLRLRGMHGLSRVSYGLLKVLGVEIPRSVAADTVRLPHGAVGLVVHESTIIGRDVRLFQGVTIGRSDQYLKREEAGTGGGVILGDDVIVGAGAAILFPSGTTVTVGRGAVIGANAVVTHDVPAGEIWAGNPAKKVRDRP